MISVQNLFTTILNMSITASYVAIAVILIRLLLKKKPKIYSYILWSVVFVRLICPVAVTSKISFLKFIYPASDVNTKLLEYIPRDIGYMKNPTVDIGIDKINTVVNGSLPQATMTTSINPMQVWLALGSMLWVIGIAVLITYSIITYIKLFSKVKTATLVNDNIFETDRINTPFVCGFIKPKIYLPISTQRDDRNYIVEHEKIHIKRLDYLVKPIAFLVLVIHWFNPLVWICFYLMSKDMEMSCDERVIQSLGETKDSKKSYSNSLLTFAAHHNNFKCSPIAFCEGSVKARIKNILKYDKPTVFTTVFLVVMVIISAIVLMTNPEDGHISSVKNSGISQNSFSPNYVEYAEELFKMKTNEAYSPDKSGISDIVSKFLLPVYVDKGPDFLHASDHPNDITLIYKMNNENNTLRNFTITDDDFYKNSIVIFSLVEKLENINIELKGIGSTYTFTHSRQMANELMGQDVLKYSQNQESFNAFLQRLEGFKRESSNIQIGKYKTYTSSITLNNQPIEYVYGVGTEGFKHRSGVIYNEYDIFKSILQGSTLSEVPYFKPEGEFTIDFGENEPTEVKIFDILINKEGKSRYTEKASIVERTAKLKSNIATFAFEGHMASNLSSNIEDYEEGKTLRGFRVICTFGEIEREYDFVIRTDAGM